MVKKAIVVLALIVLSACSSIRSIESPAVGTDSVDGLTYFMPKKDLLVTIKIEGDKIAKVTLGTTPSYPDLSKQYVLRYQANLVGKNTLDVLVTDSGLLTSANSTTVSQVSDVFKNLAATAAHWGPLAVMPSKKVTPPEEPFKCAAGDHSFVCDFLSGCTESPCGMTVRIDKRAESVNVKSYSKLENKEYSGVFYRQNIPYLVTVVGKDLNTASIVFSPSGSETHFLPVSGTFASNNLAEFGFTDGIPTKYKQETEGELVALLKLPADIIGAYFAAIGMVFDSFKTTDTKEADALAESLKLELAKRKFDACIAAINARDDKLIDQLGCNK